jgi:hypothetical protein
LQTTKESKTAGLAEQAGSHCTPFHASQTHISHEPIRAKLSADYTVRNAKALHFKFFKHAAVNIHQQFKEGDCIPYLR